MVSETEDKLKELANNLMASLCCGSDLPEDNYTLDEIFGVIKDAYDIGSNSVVWHKFPDELPKDYSSVLTVAINPETQEKHYHTFLFGEKSFVEDLLNRKRNPSAAFFDWKEARFFDIVAWCELPDYEVSNV